MTNLPPFWTAAQDTARTRQRQAWELYKANHQVILHTKDGGWKMPIYVCLNWLGRLTKNYSTLTWRRMPQVAVTPDTAQSAYDQLLADCQFWRRAQPAQHRISACGSATLKLAWDDRRQTPILRLWGTEPGEFAWWDSEPGGEPYAVSFYREEVRNDWSGRKEATICIRERFEWTGGRAIRVTNDAILKDDIGKANADRIPLLRLYPDGDVPDESTLPMTVLPAYRVLNGEEDESDYTPDLCDLQRALTSAMTTYTIAVVMSTMPQLKVPARYCNADGSVDISEMMISIYDERQPEEDLMTMSLAGNDFNLENVDRYISRLEGTYYQLTGFSAALDGQAAGSGDSGYARRLGMIKTEAAVDMKRRAWDGFWPWIGIAAPELAIAVKAKNAKRYTLAQEAAATWDPAIPPDADAESQRIERATRGGWMSLRSAIRRENPDWTEAQIEEEIAAIGEERSALAASQMASFTALPPQE